MTTTTKKDLGRFMNFLTKSHIEWELEKEERTIKVLLDDQVEEEEVAQEAMVAGLEFVGCDDDFDPEDSTYIVFMF